MRLLIDECIDERLRFLFPGHDCQTARFANLAGRKIALMILCGPTNRLQDLAPLVPTALSTLGSIEPGDVVRIG
jgi:hypothetical protein